MFANSRHTEKHYGMWTYLLAFFNSLTNVMDCWCRTSEFFSHSRSFSNLFVSSCTFSFSRPSRFSACSRSRDIQDAAEAVTSTSWIQSSHKWLFYYFTNDKLLLVCTIKLTKIVVIRPNNGAKHSDRKSTEKRLIWNPPVHCIQRCVSCFWQYKTHSLRDENVAYTVQAMHSMLTGRCHDYLMQALYK